jgi:hypothetical protein
VATDDETDLHRELPESPKLHRAVNLFHEYEKKVDQWMAAGAVVASRLTPGAFAFPTAPMEVGLIVGDCLQNLRSALDHEVYRLAVANKGVSWSGLGQCQFPIHEEEASFNHQERKQIGGLASDVRRLIRSMQVFSQPEDPVARPLLLLNKLARVDRHRLLHVTAAQPINFALKPPILIAPYIEAEVTVRVFFVDRDFMHVDTQVALLDGIKAVAWTLMRIRESDGR